MKYLEAKAQAVPGDNKMQPGNRADQHAAKNAQVKAASSDVMALASSLHVDLATVTPTGKGGTITTTDVKKASDAQIAVKNKLTTGVE
jgi:pyruvate/2-oxoglutarate dehydrogenase complex dihydrolipoamide acyltransferase (E2) component